jgi:Cu/Ag efflux protein CusF
MRSLFFDCWGLMRSLVEMGTRFRYDSMSLVVLGCQCQTNAIAVVIIALGTGSLVRSACADPATRVTTYTVKGVFEESRSGGRQAVITHETIPGYMDAMTMPFNVRDPAELGGVQPGDKITFRLSVTDTEDWIDEIKKAGGRSATTRSVAAKSDTIKELEPGALLPECIVTNQAGQIIHMSDFKGQVLAFTFFLFMAGVVAVTASTGSFLISVFLTRLFAGAYVDF